MCQSTGLWGPHCLTCWGLPPLEGGTLRIETQTSGSQALSFSYHQASNQSSGVTEQFLPLLPKKLLGWFVFVKDPSFLSLLQMNVSNSSSSVPLEVAAIETKEDFSLHSFYPKSSQIEFAPGPVLFSKYQQKFSGQILRYKATGPIPSRDLTAWQIHLKPKPSHKIWLFTSFCELALPSRSFR